MGVGLQSRNYLNIRRVQIILYFFVQIASTQDDFCQVQLTYEAAIFAEGTVQDYEHTFVGRFTLHNNLNDIDIQSWRLGFQFTDGERIKEQRDMLATNLSLVGNFQDKIVFEWRAGDADQAVKHERQAIYKFLGYKDVTQSNLTVAALTQVQFSNLECYKDEELVIPGDNKVLQVAPDDPLVEVYFKSIDTMENGDFTLQQYQVFFIDVFSLKNLTLNLKDVDINYYFQGGENLFSPDDYDAQCIDAKPLPCSNLTFAFERGVPGVPGAQNMLRIGFTDNTGYLLSETYQSELPRAYIIEQTGDSSYTKISLIIAIQAKNGDLLDISKDYSFVDAPLMGISNVSEGGQVSNRSKIPNSKIPTYFDGELIVGVVPLRDPLNDKEPVVPGDNKVQKVAPDDPLVEVQFKSIETIEDGNFELQQYQVFFIDVFNLKNKTINLKYVNLIYYFQGGENSFSTDDYIVQCIDAKPLPCSNLTFAFERGVPGIPGAQNKLRIGFTDNTGYLLSETYQSELPRAYVIEQTGDYSYTKISLIIAIQAKNGDLLDISRDYSFVDAPLIGISNVSEGGQVSLRSEIPNRKIPTYIDGELIAGIVPLYNDSNSDSDSDSYLYLVDNDTDSGLCTFHYNNGTRVCTIIVKYCCGSQTNEKLLADYLVDGPSTPIVATQGTFAISEEIKDRQNIHNFTQELILG